MNESSQSRANSTSALGTQGEAQAVQFLKEHGYTIITTNYRVGKMGEIDIIAKDGDTIVFVEVKLRRTTKYGTPEEAVTYSKQRTIRRMAEGYLMFNRIEDIPCRFDVVAIEARYGTYVVRHHKNCF
jgi:putative endonuclease